jgi:hypothetical protein
MGDQRTDGLHRAVGSVRSKAFDLLEDMHREGFAADAGLADAVTGMQNVVNSLGTSHAQLSSPPPISQDAAIVLALASTAIPFATDETDEAERWLRVMRLHGQVGAALQSLGVPEAPLETAADRTATGRRVRRDADSNPVTEILTRSRDLARQRGAATTGTLEVLFAVLSVYGSTFDRVLYARGTSRDELLSCLARRTSAAAGALVIS